MSQVSATTAPSGDMPPAFLMLAGEIREPDDAPEGYYDPETQTWIGRTPLGAGSYSNRSNGSRGGYSYQSDD